MKLKGVVEMYLQLTTIGNKDMPMKVSYKISKLLKVLSKEFANYDLNRNKLIDKYADKDSEGNVKRDDNGQIHISNKKFRESFLKEHNELMDVDVELDYKPIFKLSELENLTLTVNEISALQEFIEEEEGDTV
ncbi:MAG: hypothetical protein WDA59_05145 [Methanofastidiosum sp.]